jgi:hypothetical protein
MRAFFRPLFPENVIAEDTEAIPISPACRQALAAWLMAMIDIEDVLICNSRIFFVVLVYEALEATII